MYFFPFSFTLVQTLRQHRLLQCYMRLQNNDQRDEIKHVELIRDDQLPWKLNTKTQNTLKKLLNNNLKNVCLEFILKDIFIFHLLENNYGISVGETFMVIILNLQYLILKRHRFGLSVAKHSFPSFLSLCVCDILLLLKFYHYKPNLNIWLSIMNSKTFTWTRLNINTTDECTQYIFLKELSFLQFIDFEYPSRRHLNKLTRD